MPFSQKKDAHSREREKQTIPGISVIAAPSPSPAGDVHSSLKTKIIALPKDKDIFLKNAIN